MRSGREITREENGVRCQLVTVGGEQAKCSYHNDRRLGNADTVGGERRLGIFPIVRVPCEPDALVRQDRSAVDEELVLDVDIVSEDRHLHTEK